MNEQINNPLFFPMLVSSLGTSSPMTKEENAVVWGTYMTMSREKRDQITASELPWKIKNLQDIFHLPEMVVGNISLFIRKVFFGELTLEGCEAKIGSMLMTTGGGDPNQARAIVDFIQKEILTIQPKLRAEEGLDEEREQTKKITVNLPLLQALSKYENLGNQLITQERIKVKSQQEPVRPSLLYWLKCYRDELGIGQHDTVERGDFLFRSVNGKNLSPEERERVNLILKSIEENLPLMIDTKRQEIIFSAHREILMNKQIETKIMPPISTIRTNNLPQDATFFKPGQSDLDDMPMSQSIHSQNPFKKEEINKTKNMTMSFSAGHIFPAEKEAIKKKEETIQEESRLQKTIPTVPIPSFAPIHQSPQNRKMSDDFNPFIIHPRNNGNEENDN